MARPSAETPRNRRRFRYYAMHAFALFAPMFLLAVLNERLRLGLSGTTFVMVGIAAEFLLTVKTSLRSRRS